jgi:hypothetical protein
MRQVVKRARSLRLVATSTSSVSAWRRALNHRFYFVHTGTKPRFLTQMGIQHRGFRALSWRTTGALMVNAATRTPGPLSSLTFSCPSSQNPYHDVSGVLDVSCRRLLCYDLCIRSAVYVYERREFPTPELKMEKTI